MAPAMISKGSPRSSLNHLARTFPGICFKIYSNGTSAMQKHLHHRDTTFSHSRDQNGTPTDHVASERPSMLFVYDSYRWRLRCLCNILHQNYCLETPKSLVPYGLMKFLLKLCTRHSEVSK